MENFFMKKSTINSGIIIFMLFFLTRLTFSQGTYVLPGGSLSGSFGGWGGTGQFYNPTFNVNAPGGIDIIYYDIDLSQLNFDETSMLKGYAQPGISKTIAISGIDPANNSVWGVFHNQEIVSGTDWNGLPVSTLGPDGLPKTSDDTRHGSVQDWYKKGGAKTNGSGNDIAHNNESYVTPNPRYPGATPKTASELNTYDFRLRVLSTGGGNYTYEMWTRLHNAASNFEGCGYCATCGLYNHAISNCGEPGAWRAFENAGNTVFPITGFDFSSVYVFMKLGNGNNPSSQSLAWGKIEVTGTPTSAPSIVWVNQTYFAGGINDGHTWGFDAFASIQGGINGVATAGTVNVATGTYSENITINKPLTLNGANANIPCGILRVAESIIQPATSGVTPISLSGAGISDNVTINGFEITGNMSNNAIYCGGDGADNLTIKFNNIHDIGTGRGSGNVYAINYRVNNPSTSNINFTDNCITNIFNNTPTALGHSAAIWMGQSTANGLVSNVKIERNEISNVYSGTASKEASGIYIGVAWGVGTGGVNAPSIIDNSISNVNGAIAYGIQLSGKTPGAIVSGNIINNISGLPAGPTLAFGIAVPSTNTGSTTITINSNSITNAYYCIVNGTANNIAATCNWYGTKLLAGVTALINGPVTFVPFNNNGTDNSPAPGYQPVPNSCSPDLGPYKLYLSSSPTVLDSLVFPNTNWGVTSYEPDDWDFTAPVSFYIVPEVGSEFGASNITIQWDNTMFSFAGVDKSGGIYDSSAYQFIYDQLGIPNQVTINASRLDNQNFITTANQYIAKLNLNVLKIGFSPNNFTALDFRAFNGVGGWLTVDMNGCNAKLKSYLGDVASTSPDTTSSGDGLVNFDDLTIWSGSYWSGVGGFGMTNYKVKYDVGPTNTNTVYGMPTTDDKIQFEDLVIFSMSYGLSANHVYPKISIPQEPVELQLGEPIIVGNQTRIPLYVSGGVENLRAMSLTFAGQFGKLASVEKGSLLTEFTNPVMVMNKAEANNIYVDLAVFGAEETGICSEGEVLTLILEGNASIQLSSAELRNALNAPMAVKISGRGELLPKEYALIQNYPNPFNPVTTINYEIPMQSMVEINIYNALGEKVAVLVNEMKEAGRYNVEFNAAGYSSGIYIYQIKANEYVSVKKMILMK